jgi:hypothetical protein
MVRSFPKLHKQFRLKLVLGVRLHFNKIIDFRSRKPRLTAVGIRCADHATPSTRRG